MKISTLKSGRYYVYIRATTRGQVSETKRLSFIVCGDETVNFKKGLKRFLYFEFW